MHPPQQHNLPRAPLREGPSGSRYAGGDEHGPASPPGHPDSRPPEHTCFFARDAFIDAEEGRLRHSLFTAAPGVPDVPLHGFRRAISELPIAGADNFAIRQFWPENFLVTFTTQHARDAALSADSVPVGGVRVFLRPWTRLVRADGRTLFFRASLELDGVQGEQRPGSRSCNDCDRPSCSVRRAHTLDA